MINQLSDQNLMLFLILAGVLLFVAGLILLFLAIANFRDLRIAREIEFGLRKELMMLRSIETREQSEIASTTVTSKKKATKSKKRMIEI